MTASTDIFRRAGVDVERDEQARQAVIEGRKLVSTLTSYARALTKDSSVLVEMATRDNGSTDGRKIFWRPPMALGDRTPHQRSLCNKRGDNLQLLCAACEKREDVLVVIYHEIAHLCFDSFQQVVEGDRVNLIKDALETTGGKWAKAVQRRIEAAPTWTKNSYISMASLINEYLPIIFNALEDARVNRELFKVRKGTKIMFDAQCQKIFSEGVEQLDPLGKPCTVMWSDYPLNSQVIVGLFAKASGYTFETWFRPEVVEALKDADLTGLVNRLESIRSAQGVYHLGFPVLARLRELGFCKLPDDPDEPEDEPQPEGESEDDPSDDESSDPGDESEGEDDSDEPGDTDGGTGDSEESDPSESEDSSGGDPEDSEDEAGDSSGEGEDPDTGASDDGPKPDGGDGALSSDEEGDVSDDESDSTGSLGEPGDSEGVAEDSMEPDETGSDGESDGTSGDTSGDPASEADSGEPQQTDESHPGTGSISPSKEPVDEEDAGSRGDSSGESSDPVDESVDGSDKDDGESQDDRKNDDSGQASTSESASGDAEGSGEGSVPEDDSDDDPIDTGADRGTGGTEVIENPDNDDKPLPEHGTPEDAKTAVLKLGDHEEAPKRVYEDEANDEAIDRAIIQGMYFETPSRNIYGVREHRFGKPIIRAGESMSQAWEHSAWFYAGHSKSELGIHGDFDPPETVLGPALIRMRVAFTDNQRGKDQSHLKAGRINGRVLGRRAWADDERLFRRRIQPGKKSYFVLIGMDVSGSTLGRNIILEKRAVMAQAELCHRMGIKFAVIAHSGNFHNPSGTRADGLDLDMYLIKEPNQPWNEDTKQALRAIGPDAANLDGHSLEYYRKMIEKRPETDKIIMYYSDGKMPAENHNEELLILQREIKTCKRKNILLLGVGIRTDSPSRHGLDTVQVDSDEDIPKVVKHLEKRLSVHMTTG